MSLQLDTPIIDLSLHGVAHLSHFMAKKLAAAVASYADKSDASTATVEDLLNYFPARYEDRSNFLEIDQLYDGIEASVELFVRVSGGFQVGKNRDRKKPPLYIFEVSGGDRERTRRPVVVFWFVSGKAAKHTIEYYSERFARGTRFVAYGKWEWDGRRNTFVLKLGKPDELEVLPADEPKLLAINEPDSAGEEEDLDQDIESPEFVKVHTARRVPVYRKLGQFQTKRLREIIFDVLQKIDRSLIDEDLPADIVGSNNLLSRRAALEEIHFPPDNSLISEYEMFRSRAHKRLIFEEFFWLSFALQLKRGERRKEPKGTVIEIPKATKKRMADLLTFALTGAQRKVVKQIFDDMQSSEPMNRLVQGDVGSGKTIVAFLAMFAAMENGYQAAMMAPTELLAEQHARNAVEIFRETGYRVGLLTGSMKASDKRKLHNAIASGDVQLVIGTHALIQEAVAFENLGLAVIDEQHRFGVLQRAEFRKRGLNPDVLVMTATPIPRSLAMTVYGDLDVSIIDELPPGRTPVKTVVLGEDQREGVYKGMEREIKLGRQVYVVYPLVEESEKIDLKAATKEYEHLRDKIFPHRSVGLIHGRMKPSDKEETMRRFAAGDLDILVSTTVIEVGVDVPNASLMVIEHAERLGLSQLHQLRGRVGRGAEQSYCVLLTGDKKTVFAKQRLGIMEETNDGFKIAEKDLEIRGQGEIFGTRQSGIQLFRIANIVRDIEILESARREAENLLTKKRHSPETATLINKVRSGSKFKLAGIG
ncbi:MAG: ATP-dependent DNA helicase RecG [Pyrinomonadaceae bacterium]|nr:ATP-dependent DNA helicase RecG [Blastocatellia bacterium]MCW5958179.1 ATP-dependent DNA helicase RecG [Pyrinomonadaceae bacterium]